MHDHQLPAEEHAKLSWIWLSFFVMVIDQASKYWIAKNYTLHEVSNVLPGLNIYLTYNKGAAFSFLHNNPDMAFWLLSGITILMSTGILIWMYRLPKTNTWLSVSFALILGGALGNLIDRLRFGFVIDFISVYFQNWYFAIFNVADMAISTGATMIVLHLYWMSRRRR